MQKNPSYALVLSDLHFGDTRCTLHSMGVVRRLVEALQPYSPLTQIILLGDILDLQLANWAQAMEGRFLQGPDKRAVGFRYFLQFLVKETGATSVVYVPGNHDYRIFEYHSIERHLLRPLRTGKKLSGRVSFYRSFPDSFLRGLLPDSKTGITVVYPHYARRVGNSRVIFTHGHFFDPSQAFNHEIGRLFSKSEAISDKERRMIRSRYFKRVSLYQNVVTGISMQKKLREMFNAVYHPITMVQKSWRHKSRKSFLTPAMKRSIQQYAAVCCRPGRVDGMIFGHTHHPGAANLTEGIVQSVWNTGTFLRESENSPLGSFLTVQLDGRPSLKDAVKLHLLR